MGELGEPPAIPLAELTLTRSPEVIEVLENMLAQARAGRVRGVEVAP